MLDGTSTPHKLITPAGDANSHMLGGEVFPGIEPIIFMNQPWITEAKKWLEGYLR
jgi:hypothetical protein